MLGLFLLFLFLRIAECVNWISYQSIPSIRVPVLDISINNQALVSPGYIFIAPYNKTDAPGPFIFDSNGDLIWALPQTANTETVHDFHVCDYDGSDHLCFYQGPVTRGFSRGRNVILNTNYQPIKYVQSGNGLPKSDLHETKIVNGQSMLTTIYQARQFDLRALGGPRRRPGWVLDGIFQEIDIKTGKVLFQWRSVDHIGFEEGVLPIGATSPLIGDGVSAATAWDYFHINSIEKDGDGNYLVSGRHTNTMYKVSGKDGRVLWRLGGKHSTYTLTNYNFSAQHDARIHQQNATHTTISFFDNANNGVVSSSPVSSAKIVILDHVAHTSTLIRQYEAPGKGFKSTSQGNAQLLANGNVFVGWGNNPAISEHQPDGTTIFFAELRDNQAFNYRAFKQDWSTTPSQPPSLFTSAASRDGPTVFWVSWNGATTVNRWRFYGSSSDSNQPVLLAEVPRQGFQTVYTSADFHAQGFAEAVAEDGMSLGKSAVVNVAVRRKLKS